MTKKEKPRITSQEMKDALFTINPDGNNLITTHGDFQSLKETILTMWEKKYTVVAIAKRLFKGECSIKSKFFQMFCENVVAKTIEGSTGKPLEWSYDGS